MHSLTKRIIASLIIALACMPFTMSIYFVAQQQLIHVNVARQFKIQPLETISIHKTRVSWIREGKELLINDKLFDVKFFSEAGDYLRVTGLFDTKEDELNNQVLKSEKENSPVNPTSNNLLFSFLFQPLFSNLSSIYFSGSGILTSTNYNFSQDENLYSIYRNITSPPPKSWSSLPVTTSRLTWCKSPGTETTYPYFQWTLK